MINLNTIHEIDALKGLRKMPDNFVDCCVTSPPYYGLRDYGHPNQIGLEETPEKYVKKLVKIFSELNRVLKKEGTLWLNIGDSYAGSGKGIGDNYTGRWKQGTHPGSRSTTMRNRSINGQIKSKDLIGIPWMVAFALRKSGWYLRQDIIWSKPNPMPESVTDRCTKAHEYLFLLSKSSKYFYDHESIKKPIKDTTIRRIIQEIENQKGSDRVQGKTNGNMKAVLPKRNPRPSDNRKGNQGTGGIPVGLNGSLFKNHNNYLKENGELLHSSNANKKSVWEVIVRGYKDAHFATFPQALIVDCIKAGCPENGVVLDPFMGSGTTALVSKKLNRQFIGFELNPEYIAIANNRLRKELGLFL